MDERNRLNLLRLAAAAVLVVLLGTIALSSSEHISFGEALYSTLLILLSHFDENSHHTTVASKTTVLLLILASYLVIAYLIKLLVDYIMGLSDNLRRRQVHNKIKKMRGHFIVCGLGRVGSQVAKELANENVPFVALDRDSERVGEAVKAGYLALNLDSTNEEALKEAGLERAKALISSLGEDSHNLFVTLAAKSINPDIYIVSRANRQESEVKLRRAGADRVALPYQIGGYHMANMALMPAVVDYISDEEFETSAPEGIDVEEMLVGSSSELAGKPLGRNLVDGTRGVTVIAINGADGETHIKPTGQEVVYPGDRLIILGNKEELTHAADFIK